MADYRRAPSQDQASDRSSAFMLQRISAAGWTQAPAPPEPQADHRASLASHASPQGPVSPPADSPAWPVPHTAGTPSASVRGPRPPSGLRYPSHQSYASEDTSLNAGRRHASGSYVGTTPSPNERTALHFQDPDVSEASNGGGGGAGALTDLSTDPTAPLIGQHASAGAGAARDSFAMPPRSSAAFSAQHKMHPSLSSTSMLSYDAATSFSRDRAKRRALKNLRTLLVIFGGWGCFLVACLAFKLMAIRVNLVAPDSLAEAIKSHPQMATQLFTIFGNILAECCLVLWGMSISYLAFRAVVFGENIELLTLQAWSELTRGGYTLSRRKLAWPLVTPVIWLGALFLAPGFTTLITPVLSSKNTTISTREIDQLSPGFVNHFMNGFVGRGEAALLPINVDLIPTCYNHLEVLYGNSTTVIKCLPGETDFHTSRQASQASLQAYLGIRQPYVPLFGGWQFFGRTRGLMPIGPDGLVALTDKDFKTPPPGSVHPKGFARSYELDQQGLSASANCQGMSNAQLDRLITVTPVAGRSDLSSYAVRCPQETSYFNSDNAIPVMDSYSRSSVIVPLICYHTDVDRASSRSHTIYLLTVGSGAASILNSTLCTLTPYWHQTRLTYPSTTGILNASVESTRFLSYIDVGGGPPNVPELPFAQFMEEMSTVPATLIRNYHTHFNALGLYSSLVNSNTLLGMVNDTSAASGGAWAVAERNQLLQHLQNIVLDFDIESTITMPMLEQYLLGIWDFHATTTRQYQSAVLRMVGNNTLVPFHVNDDFNDPAVTRPCTGVWRGATLGWGLGNSGNDVTATVVFVSLIPLFVFAVMSWAISLYAHIRYRNGKLAYYGHFDPCDITQAVIAASAGGMMDAFDSRALSEDAGLHGARKVRVRLGRVFNPSDAGGKVKIGYVTI